VADGLTDLPPGIELRLTEPGDRDFLLAVYGSTRADELALVPWSQTEKAAFVASQFEAQDLAYHQTYPDAQFLLVVADGQRIGRLYLDRVDDELRVIEIALLPEHRGRGIGSGLMTSIAALADREGRSVTLHVEPWNPAKRIYERLGFASEGVSGIYEFMRRPATTAAQLKTAS
jgi:ribosomal protein S18 acetylase RimI-like enzyme